jgi:hypothetical protein
MSRISGATYNGDPQIVLSSLSSAKNLLCGSKAEEIKFSPQELFPGNAKDRSSIIVVASNRGVSGGELATGS